MEHSMGHSLEHPKMTGFHVINGIFLGLLAVIGMLPIVHVLAVSLSDRTAVVAGAVSFLPVGFSLDAYRYVLEDQQFMTSFGVTLLRVAIGVPVNLLLTVLTAYPLSKKNSRFHGRTVFAWFFVISMVFSGGLIPLYMVINKLGLLNTIWALTLPGAMNVGYMILMMNFFRNVPEELEDAAIMDGAGQMQILFKIYLPTCLPALATIVLFAAVANWNCWMDGYMYMNTPDKYPLQTYLASVLMESKINMETMMTPDQLAAMSGISDKNVEAAQILLAALPIMCVYPLLQKYYTKGIMIGSVKG